MCYAIPGKLVNIEGRTGTVDYFGEKKRVLIDCNVKTGDYIYAQGGIVVSKVPHEEAVRILDFWKNEFFELQRTDRELARMDSPETSDSTLRVLQKVNLKQKLTRGELLELMALTGENEIKLLYDTANNIRQGEHGNACCVHGIIEFSNHCRRSCQYCGIRKNSDVRRYRMSVDEIINTAKHAVKELGFRALVLQSGEDLQYSDDELVEVVREIRGLGVLVFISIGTRDKELYKKLYDAGARAALLRFETSNKELFEKLRPGTSFDERLELIRYVKKLGYVLATGFISGLPGETDEDVINNILLTKSLEPDMYSFGPLIPAKGTPLEDQTPADLNSVLKTIALARLADRNSNILVTTALETLDKGGKRQGLVSGANSLMVNLTPAEYRKLYTIYPNRPDSDKEVDDIIKQIIDLLKSLGRAPSDVGYKVLS
jgi:biotin synthase